jgi:hypothetical protein
MVAPDEASLIETDWPEKKLPPEGLKTGVAAGGSPEAFRATITLTEVSVVVAVAVAV